MKSIKKTFTMTTVTATVYDRDLTREVEKKFDFDCKVSAKRAAKEIKEYCAKSSMIFIDIKSIENHKVTYIMPFDKFISSAEKVEVSEVE